jgi:hypothetical protein
MKYEKESCSEYILYMREHTLVDDKSNIGLEAQRAENSGYNCKIHHLQARIVGSD